jgi:4-hydroxy-L-threonine phosphate dehydrogenase PdxA
MDGSQHNLIGNEIVIGVTMGDPGGIGPEIVVTDWMNSLNMQLT